MKPLVLTAVLLGALTGAFAETRQPTGQTPPAQPAPLSRYFCPMKCEGEKTYDQPGRCPVCKMKLKAVQADPAVRLELVKISPSPVTPGVVATVSLRLQGGQLETDAAGANSKDRTAEFFFVSQNLSWLAHQGSSLSPGGDASVTVRFPISGGYLCFADLGPGRPKPDATEIVVPGDKPTERTLVADAKPQRLDDGYQVALSGPGSLKTNEEVSLSFTISRDGQPVKELGRSISDQARLVLISENKHVLITSSAATEKNNSAPPETAGAHAAPTLRFDVTAPAPGLYAVWVEFEHGDKTRQARFVLEAKP